MALVRILVDGYSLLHNWPELANGRPRHSAAARDELIRRLTLYGDGRDYIDGYLGQVAAATPEQVAAARAVFPDSKDLVIVAIGDAARIRDVMRGYGPVTEMKITDPRFSP